MSPAPPPPTIRTGYSSSTSVNRIAASSRHVLECTLQYYYWSASSNLTTMGHVASQIAVTPNRRGVKSRALVLDAAERVMAADGFEAATIARVVEEAGVPLSSVYHYFGSKDGVLLAVMERGAERFFADLPEPDRRVGTSCRPSAQGRRDRRAGARAPSALPPPVGRLRRPALRRRRRPDRRRGRAGAGGGAHSAAQADRPRLPGRPRQRDHRPARPVRTRRLRRRLRRVAERPRSRTPEGPRTPRGFTGRGRDASSCGTARSQRLAPPRGRYARMA